MTQDKEAIVQSLLGQQVYLDILRGRHLTWANGTDDPEIKRFHTEIADLLQQSRDQYYELLTAYQMSNSEFVLDLNRQVVESEI